MFMRIKKGFIGEGKIGLVLGETVYVDQPWVPMLFEDQEDPDFFKEYGLEWAHPPKRLANKLRKRQLTRFEYRESLKIV